MAVIVDLEEERDRKGASLDQLAALVGSDLVQVNTAIVERMHSPVALIPELAGRLDGVAVRVPVEDGSLTDLTAVVSRLALDQLRSARVTRTR